jgi:hypothetical protein
VRVYIYIDVCACVYVSLCRHLGLLVADAVDGEPALDIVQQTELLVSLGDGDDICR